MNSHRPNIKLTVETNPTRFLDTAFSKNLDGSVTTNVFHKPGKLPTFEILRYQKDISGITYEVTCIMLLNLLQILIQRFRQLNKNIYKLDIPSVL